MASNLWSDVSSIAAVVQEGAYHVVRANALMQGLVYTYNDMQGMNLRKTYAFNQLSAKNHLGEDDDLTSSAFTPSVDQTFTPAAIGLQVFLTDARRDSEVPENFIRDASNELGLAALDQIESDLITDMASLTGGTIGTAGTAITWGYLAAAIAQARVINKSNSVPLFAVIHGYQWAVLAKSASIAGAAVGTAAPNYADLITRTGFAAEFMGVPIYQALAGVDSNTDFTGGVFRRECLAIDWRTPVHVEPERDASRRGTEFNMSAIYAHGVKRPALGVKMIFDATAPTS
jgi:hypothetical protein